MARRSTRLKNAANAVKTTAVTAAKTIRRRLSIHTTNPQEDAGVQSTEQPQIRDKHLHQQNVPEHNEEDSMSSDDDEEAEEVSRALLIGVLTAEKKTKDPSVIPARLKVKAEATLDLTTIFSHNVVVDFPGKDGIVEAVTGRWCLVCKSVASTIFTPENR